MPKKISSPKATGGGGHAFESKVAAYFVAKMLAGQPPFEPADGLLRRIDFQTRVDGWFLDDMLLTLGENGTEHKRSFSVKSNAQFTTKKAPTDFVAASWEQYLHKGSSKFDRTKDLLGIIVSQLGQSVSQAVSALRRKAVDHDPADLARRVSEPDYMSQVERDLFASFACPTEFGARHSTTAIDTAKLLARVLVSDFDFERADSSRLREADLACRDALLDPAHSASLWDSILNLVTEHRASGGYLDRAKVLSRLRGRFEFKAFPFHGADWGRLSAETNRAVATINDTIGGTTVLDRARARDDIDKAMAEAPVVCLLGGSGLGKTAVAKSLLAARSGGKPAIWFNAQDFEKSDLASFEAKLKLAHPLDELLAGACGGVVVIDAVDRVYSEAGFKNISLLIQQSSALWSTHGWRVLLTSQPEEWDRVQRELFRAKADPRTWVTTTLALPSTEEVRPVWKAFPGLQPISTRPDLHPILLRPKVLDLLANRIVLGQAPDFKNWVGESDFIAWFWDSEVRKGADGPARARFAQQLAERQAALVAHEVPSDEFSVSDLKPVPGLTGDRLCAESEGRISFTHDLFGDWARQSILVGRAPTLDQLAERALSPLWHKPIRLYGLYLLESRDKAPEWVRLIQQPADQKQRGEVTLAQELLLEAVIIAGNSESVLEKALPDLLRDKGVLLKRLLECFLHVATFPNAQFMSYAEAVGLDQAQAAVINRNPFWPFWLPMLRFLSAHSAQTSPLAPWATAKICETWLLRGGSRWPLRREAATMALQLAEMFGAKDDLYSARLHGEAEETMYRAALVGAADLPDEVAAIARKLCRRSGVSDSQKPTPEKRPAGKIRRVISSLYGEYDETVPAPWPDGPNAHVDPAFQRVCLNTDALRPLVDVAPAIAKEVLLACLIDEPKPRGIREYMSDLHFGFGIEKPMQWFPPLFSRGPFFAFLQLQPAEALDCILRLVNFTVERWREHGESKGGHAPRITVEIAGKPRVYLGDFQTAYWYRGEMGPDAVEVALMALEKYLYDQVDAGKDVVPILETILERSNSVAPLGVLIALGNKKPELYTGVLQPLLGVAKLHEWERARGVSGDDVWRISWGARNSIETKIAVEWHQLPHRRRTLQDVALHLFHNHKESRRYLDHARKEWERRAKTLDGDASDKLLNLAALFDAANWHPENSDPSQRRLQFVRPKELQERNAPHLKKIEASQLLLTFPMQCRRILDGELQTDSEGLDAFWKKLRDIEAMDPAAAKDSERKENSVCGGIAVLVLKHRDWLFAHEERKRWCANYIGQVIETPPPPTEFDSPVAHSDWYWDRFCAQVAPIFWSEDASSSEWRRRVALLATSSHFETVSYLFASALTVRDRLGDEFLMLQHLLLRWAAEHAAWYEACHGQDISDLKRRCVELIQLFIDRRIPAKIPGWREVAARRRGSKTTGRKGRKPRQLPGFEIQLLQAAFQVYPALSQARDDRERADWISLWTNALNVTFDMIGKPDEDGLDDGVPYDYDRWVLGRAAETIVEMKESEQPNKLWEPIFKLGLGAHYWVEDFFYKWFQVGRKFDSVDSPFFRRWMAMIEHARRTAVWGAGPDSRRGHRRELWWQLLGLSLLGQSFWSKERRAIANAMKGHFREWSDAHLAGGDAAKLFSYFLMREATIDLVPDGLIWLDAGMQRASAWYWDETDISPELAAFLSHAWGRCSKEIRAAPDAMKAFNRILAELAAKNEPVALQLRDQIASSR